MPRVGETFDDATLWLVKASMGLRLIGKAFGSVQLLRADGAK
jgi:hypothetical protein